MMKTVLLLVIAAVCVSAAPSRINEKGLLMHLVDELNAIMKYLPKHFMGVFLSDLKVKGQLPCTNEFFCQAEEELRRKVSGLSGAKYKPFHTERELMRNLHEFNKHHMKSCETVDDKDEISLPEFLQDLKRCVQKMISTSAK